MCQCRYGYGDDNCSKEWQNPCTGNAALSWTNVPHTKYRDPNSSQKYVACVGRQMVPKECSPKEFFDPDTSQCVQSHSFIANQDISTCNGLLCLHGVCVNNVDSKNEYEFPVECRCNKGYIGASCNIIIDPCSSHPCNQHKCVRGESDLYYCECTKGGQRISPGPCTSSVVNPCLNKTDGSVVPVQWDKTLFSICLGRNVLNLRRCQAGCQWIPSSQSCQQIKGNTGEIMWTREHNSAQCVPNSCLNGGICKAKISEKYPSKLSINSFQCVCQAGTAGPYCEQVTDPCIRNPCGDNGYCRRVSSVGHICICGSTGGLITDQECPGEESQEVTTDADNEAPVLSTLMCLPNWTVPMTGAYRERKNGKDGDIMRYIKCMQTSSYSNNRSFPVLYYSLCPWPLKPVPNPNTKRLSGSAVCYNGTFLRRDTHELMHPLIQFSQFLRTDHDFYQKMYTPMSFFESDQDAFTTTTIDEHNSSYNSRPSMSDSAHALAFKEILNYPLVLQFTHGGVIFNVSVDDLNNSAFQIHLGDDESSWQRSLRSLIPQVQSLLASFHQSRNLSSSAQISTSYTVSSCYVVAIVMFLTLI